MEIWKCILLKHKIENDIITYGFITVLLYVETSINFEVVNQLIKVQASKTI